METVLLLFSWPIAILAMVMLGFTGWSCRRWLQARRSGGGRQVSEALTLDGGHRVASTLQMILSLLRVHERRVRNSEERPAAAAAALRAAGERISTVAIVHRELQQVAEAGATEMERLLWMVIDTLVVGTSPDRQIDVRVRCEPLRLPSRLAIPLALVVGEWATHRLERHKEQLSAIRVEVRTGEDLHVLDYLDDGPHWDAALDDAMLNAQVVSAMVQQLAGTRPHPAGPGMHLRLSFPRAADPPPGEG